MATESHWELVSELSSGRDDGCDMLERFRVPGGWLYRTVFMFSVTNETRTPAVAMVFVPEPTP